MLNDEDEEIIKDSMLQAQQECVDFLNRRDKLNADIAIFSLGYLNGRFLHFEKELTQADKNAFKKIYNYLLGIYEEE